MTRVKQYKATCGDRVEINNFRQFQAEMVKSKLHPDGLDLKHAKKLMTMWNDGGPFKYELIENERQI